MTTFAIVVGLILVVAGMFSYIQKLNFKAQVKAQPAITRSDFTVTINYTTSFIKTYQDVSYLFLNVTVFNKMDTDMDDVTIETEPKLEIVNDLNYRATTEKWPVDRYDPVHADTLQSRVLNIEPGNTVSGYVIVKTPRAMCNVDAITVSNKDISVTIPVRKEKVLMKTGNVRR